MSSTLLYTLSLILFAEIAYSTQFAFNLLKLREKKREVVVGEGKSTGFEKGEEVCFYVNDELIGKGIVDGADNFSSTIKISKELLKELSKESFVELCNYNTKPKSVRKKESAFVFYGGWFSESNPQVNYNYLSFKPLDESMSESNWESSQKNTSTNAAINLGVDFLQYDLSFSFVQKYYKEIKISSNYGLTSDLDGNRVDNFSEAYFSSIRFGYFRILDIASALRFRPGLEIELHRSLINFNSIHRIDDQPDFSEELTVSKSEVFGVSLSVPLYLDLKLTGNSGLRLGASYSLPVYSSSSLQYKISKESKFSDQSKSKSKKDFERALGHHVLPTSHYLMGIYYQI